MPAWMQQLPTEVVHSIAASVTAADREWASETVRRSVDGGFAALYSACDRENRTRPCTRAQEVAETCAMRRRALALLAAGAHPTAHVSELGDTALHIVVHMGSDAGWATDVVPAMLAVPGVNVDARGFHDFTPLHWAAEWDPSGAMTKVLLDGGADRTLRDSRDGHTALDLAVMYGIPNTEALLRESPAGT